MHALQECWRVLASNGKLLDIRPRTSNPDVELIFNESFYSAGQIDDSAGQIDDEAADRAIANLVSRDFFVKLDEQRFSFAFYWPTLDQMQAYIEKYWGDYAILPPDVVRQARELALKNRPENYRIREIIMFSDYRKLPVD